ncbi:DNA repair protein RecO [Membranicola marinus]|uniref:DNA repair protein RecO n=1 Tax=Membranihabitans marinus TaxID=1227546 RepID=A0A953HY10_9BACT|nr:DNA repair protein RecO [Membranihabitans marinus]MBY5959868.1 DNA repair protein RecO [Membranihabitans marinus]
MSRIVQSSGVVIRRMNYGESSMIVDIYTETHGLSGFIISGVRKSKPKISPVVFTPGYQLSLVFYERDPHQLWRIKEASIEQQLERTPFDIIRGNTALCMCEVIKKIVHPYDPNSSLYYLLTTYFLALDQIEKSGNLFMHFLVQMSIQMGFGPKEPELKGMVFFDLKSGHFLKEEPSHPLVLGPEISALLQRILQIDIDELSSISMERSHRQQLTDGLIDYIRYHSHANQEIKSYDLLKKIW